ncbi:hypothetical protein ACHAWF_018752 [Thalassiosira exigua]
MPSTQLRRSARLAQKSKDRTEICASSKKAIYSTPTRQSSHCRRPKRSAAKAKANDTTASDENVEEALSDASKGSSGLENEPQSSFGSRPQQAKPTSSNDDELNRESTIDSPLAKARHPTPHQSKAKSQPDPPSSGYGDEKENAPRSNNQSVKFNPSSSPAKSPLRPQQGAAGFEPSRHHHKRFTPPTKKKSATSPRRPKPDPSQRPAPPAKKELFTKEQLDSVDKVLSAKGSHYKVLDIPTSSNEEEVRRAYKRKALKLHPDKNRAPNSSEAFKAINEAYEILKSPNKRQKYDRDNNENAQAPTSSMFSPGSSHFNTIPAGTPVTTLNNYVTGTIVSFQNGKYSVQMDGGLRVREEEPSALLQNVNVCVRWDWHILGMHAKVVSYDEDLRTYEVRHLYHSNIVRTISCCGVIIPQGTIVRLEGLWQRPELNGKSGTVVNWTQTADGTGRYDVQLSANNIVRVKMDIVRL